MSANQAASTPRGLSASSAAVVIPCLNEAENLDALLPRVQSVIEELDLPAAVYVVDGGSTDASVEIAQRHGARVLRQRGEGYGGAIRTAFEDIDAEYLITLDADFSHHPAILKYLCAMRHEADIVIASRYVAQGHAEMPWMRKALSRILNAAFRRILSVPVYDLSSGYRLYNRKAVASLDLRFSTYAVLQEILVKAFCEGYTVREIPFHYQPRRHGKTHARLIRFGRDYLAALGRMWALRNGIESADYDTRAFFSRIPLQRYWQRKRYRILLRFIGDHLRVLDCGCGSSQLLNGAPQVIGLDIQPRKLRFMRRPGRRLVNASALDLPFRDGAFEVVVCSEMIEHLPESERLFEELGRCVEPGGLLILGTPDYGRWQWPVIETFYRLIRPSGYADEHITRYTRQGLLEQLNRADFRVEDQAYILGGELILKARKPVAETNKES
jgi:glycosyltransferase involved in cell wall biosynthesis